MIVIAIYSVGFLSNSSNQALRGVLYLWLVCHIRIDMEMVLVKVLQSLLQRNLGVSTNFNEAAFSKPRLDWATFQFCTLCSRSISGSQVNEEWGHTGCIQTSGCRVAKNEAGELSSICHSSTETSSLGVDVAPVYLLNFRVHEYTEEKKGKIYVFVWGWRQWVCCVNL